MGVGCCKAAKKKAAKKKVAVEYPTCVRHLKTRKDVKLRHFFMCDICTNTWTTEAFDGNAPLYVGESIVGYCGLCNKLTTVKLRTWHLCDICHRVAGSIGRNHVAEQAILDYWQAHVRPKYPNLKIVQNDKSALRPRRDTDTKASAPIDFLVIDEETDENVFGIENKTGRSSIWDMSQFQLDCSDCDTILNDMSNMDIPAYVVHAQVLELWQPPTMGFHTIGLWYADVYTMAEHFKSVRARRDEMRGAAYFSRKAFSPMEEFLHSFVDEDGESVIVKRYEEDGIPEMYHIDN